VTAFRFVERLSDESQLRAVGVESTKQVGPHSFPAEVPVDHQSGSRAADSKYETLADGLGHRSELEERMAPSLGKVLLGRVIDADPASP
jgi:hypothetical protein